MLFIFSAVKCCLFFQPLHLFIFFCSLIHIWEWEEHIWFPNLKGFSCFASSGLSASNMDDAWHFEVRGSPSIALERTFWSMLYQDLQATDCIFIISCAWSCPNKMEFSIQSCMHRLCVGHCHHGKMNETYLCIRIWKVFVRLTVKHSEDVLCSNNLVFGYNTLRNKLLHLFSNVKRGKRI
jgi:hypothetical protein